jgi:hypothetical protein
MDVDKKGHDLEDDLTALERRVAAWRPAAGLLNRDRTLFDAGRAAALAEGRSRVWQLATAASALLTVTLGALLAHERADRVALESRTAALAATQNPEPPMQTPIDLARIEPAEPNSYLALTTQLAKGSRDLFSLDNELESQPRHRPPDASSSSAPTLEPLRPIDVERVLDL